MGGRRKTGSERVRPDGKYEENIDDIDATARVVQGTHSYLVALAMMQQNAVSWLAMGGSVRNEQDIRGRDDEFESYSPVRDARCSKRDR